MGILGFFEFTKTPFKLAPHTHFNESAMAFMVHAATELRAGETTLCGLPLFHVNGTTVTGSMPFSIGAHVVLLGVMGYRDPAVMKNFYKIVEHYRAVTFSSVPTVLSVLLDVPKGDADISSLRYAVCGAAPLSVELFKRFEAHNSGIWAKEGWFNTGDLGRQDTDGYFWLTGRKKELIMRGGHNIDPAAIEEPLYRLDGVQVAAAVGRPDPHAGELPVAYVQLQEGSDLTSEQILDYLKKEVGERAAVPKSVFIIEQVPLTPVGKIFKPALRWEAIRQVYQEELAALGDMVESVNVTVKEDKVHGSLATITVKPASDALPEDIKKRVTDILTRYTIKYRLEIICQ